ncbi:DnaA N-terminal domain-containing protein [Peribacillus muralis]|uniref:DnaA N-terminal domain-containing protein n=1 Tax=Peribacillus muralis TaxID=264697 RepID=UPI00070DE35A|nr:DnaA N-terminal domain-containing protein [Peribacillus muralis]
MNDKDILMKELQELKTSLEHEVRRVTKIIAQLTHENDAELPIKDDHIHMETSNELFSLVKIQLQQKVSMPSYETWFKDVFAASVENDLMTLVAPNELVRDWLEERYGSLIISLLKDISGKDYEIRFIAK